VLFDLLDDVFLLHLALKAPQSVFKRLSFLKPNFSQSVHTSIRNENIQAPSEVIRMIRFSLGAIDKSSTFFCSVKSLNFGRGRDQRQHPFSSPRAGLLAFILCPAPGSSGSP
jgi:hypothetical protein